MFSSMFDGSTVPVLEQVVNFTQARHGVLAGNLANLDTPGYKTRDLSTDNFRASLKAAVKARREPHPTHYYQPAALQPDSPGLIGSHHEFSSPLINRPGASDHQAASYAAANYNTANRQDADFSEVKDSMKSILYHDQSDVSLEQQVTQISKNQAEHNLALSLMTAQFRLLRAAITERA